MHGPHPAAHPDDSGAEGLPHPPDDRRWPMPTDPAGKERAMRCPITRVVPVGSATALASLVLAGTALAAAPSNDTFANATAISSLPFSDTVDTTGATTDSDDKAAGAACGVSGQGPTERQVRGRPCERVGVLLCLQHVR